MRINMKAKRKSAHSRSQGWSNNYQYAQSLSDSCSSILLSIARATHDANREYLSIVETYLNNRRVQRSSQPRFSQSDLYTMRVMVQRGSPADTTTIPKLLESLEDVTYTDIWARAAENMAYLKGHWKHQTRKQYQDSAVKRATNLQSCRVIIETGFNQVEKEMRSSYSGADRVCDGIRDKIDMLYKFEEAYPIPVNAPPAAPLKLQTPVLLLVALTYLVVSFMLLSVAWAKSTGDRGSVEDPDFWIGVQNGIGLIFGLLVSIYTARRRSREGSTAWKCALWFTAGGIVCGVVSVPVYLYLSPMWSASAAFCASMAQLGVMLEVAIMTDSPKLKQA
ncbi:hypothetical protein GGR52DRAFT_297131 [Hypoxylon sp. FL1284]|nr:hypothetical protein GGR52DRAFT_297131 [Hypoxylon sp. FL1284]